MVRVLAAVSGLALVVVGWNVWTGRWRTWAHPHSGHGLFPLVALPVGVTVLTSVVVDPEGEATRWWEIPSLLLAVPGVLALPVLTVSLFVPIRRIPPFLRPRWLPAEWRASGFKEPRGLAFPSLAAPFEAEVPPGSEPRLARWEAIHVDDDPAVSHLYVMHPEWRFGALNIYADAAVFAQHEREDSLRGGSFFAVFRPGEVRRLSFVPSPPSPWWKPLRHYPVPRLILETTSGSHHLAVIDRPFRRRPEAGLALLSEVLDVRVVERP